MKKGSFTAPVLLALLMSVALSWSALAATLSPRPVNRVRKSSKSARVSENAPTQKRISHSKHGRRVARKPRRRYWERFYTSSYATDQTEGDITTGEDPVVRGAAIDALGNMNGTVVAVNPKNGRILAMVNQKLALAEGAQPCSTIKLAVALAALSEGLVTKDTKIALTRRQKVDLTDALAHSNNLYFEALGRKLGFEKVSYYARQFGLGELAGYDIAGEHLGVFPAEELDAKLGGVGKMCSFGESISLTPLQLAALTSAIANGGTLYYLQHPETLQQASAFQPKVKRYLDIAPLIPEMTEGMAGAVEYGTARSLRYNFSEEPVLGKTGTCSKDGTRFGWFASYADTHVDDIVVVVFLQGGHATYGPKAAEIAGRMYRELYDRSFFAGGASTGSAPTEQSGGASQ